MIGDRKDDRAPSGAGSFVREVTFGDRQPQPQRPAGAVIAGRYRLDRLLGEGGMGVVWAAQHVSTRGRVALKFLKGSTGESGETRKRFLREARAACAVRHPSIVDVHEVLELEDGSPVIVMDLLQGETLGARLEQRGRLPLAEVAGIMVPVCAAVGAIHARGIVHRDLKPENIFLCDGRDARASVKVLDFGIAKLTALEGEAARTGATTTGGLLLGTPFYMAPEQMFGEKDVDHRADLWALGIILYEALSGKRPTQGSNLGQILKVVAKEGIEPLRVLAPTLPQPVLDLVSRLLEQDRDQRLADMRQVVAVLSKYTDVVADPFGAPPVVSAAAATTSTGRKIRVDAQEAHAATGSATPRGAGWTRPSPLAGSVAEPRRPVRPEAPAEIRVKGSVLLGVLQACAEVDPGRGREAVARQLGPELADCLRSGGPIASSWYPIAWHRELLAVVAAHAGTAGLRAVIRRSTRDSVGKIHRVVVRVLSPDVLISRSSSLFSSFFEGTITAHPQSSGRTRVVWNGCHGFDRNCWLAQIHTVEELVAMSGATLIRRSVALGGGDGDSEMALELTWK